MSLSRKTEVLLWTGLLAGLTVGCAMLLLWSAPQASNTDVASVTREYFQLPDVALVDQAGRPRKLNAERGDGHLSVISFNYTACESVCGVGNAIMQALDRELPDATDQTVRLMSITINPREDTPALMAKAAREYGPSENWLWLTGDPADIDTILDRANVRSDDIQVHELVFLIGDPRTKRYYKLDAAAPDVQQIVAALKAISKL